jgi:hypothetical protein
LRRQIDPTRRIEETRVKFWKKLQNPFALVFQGFLVGGLLFWTTQGQAGQPAPLASVAAPASN